MGGEDSALASNGCRVMWLQLAYEKAHPPLGGLSLSTRKHQTNLDKKYTRNTPELKNKYIFDYFFIY
jgi:hypothetical protein